jgi:hypothetical protein
LGQNRPTRRKARPNKVTTEKEAAEAGDIRVTDLKVVSDTCK